MKRLVTLLLSLSIVLVACTTAPITGRRQLVLLGDEQAAQLGAASYQEILSQMPLSDNREYQQEVRTIGNRIVSVLGKYDQGFNWEFNVLEDPTPNAFALPGGKVGVHTGLFDVAETRNQLAVVMAHEIGHAIARHGAERVSQSLLPQLGLAVVGAATESPQLVGLLSQVATLGYTLPHSRTQESEADEIGLVLMARAGYDPSEADDLWINFSQLGGERPPEFLSTHPAPETRIRRIRAMLPEACEIYRQSTGKRCADPVPAG